MSRKPPRKNRCIRFSDDEWQRVHELADAAGRKPAAFVRAASLRPLRAPRIPSAADPALVRQLLALGNNLNQLTKLEHQGRPQPPELRLALEQLRELLQSL